MVTVDEQLSGSIRILQGEEGEGFRCFPKEDVSERGSVGRKGGGRPFRQEPAGKYDVGIYVVF